MGVASSVVAAAACLDEATVLGFLAGTLAPDARGGVEMHVAACSACAEILTWAAADSANASRAPGREGAPFIGQLAPGARVDRYQILAPVGRGGMGEVYAAYHPDLDRRIALKIVFETGGDAAERRARLLREARAIARLSHPNVITVFDAGTVGDRVYIAMEFVDGETADEWVRAKKRTWQEILDVFVAAGRGLAAAHAAGIIHRDFKPQNVMIGKDGSVRVMDFGLAQLVREDVGLDQGSLLGGAAAAPGEKSWREGDTESGPAPTVTRATKTGALLGTPAYMAPEQFRSDLIDARADQFGFCVALHEALYGARPTLRHIESGNGISTDDAYAADRSRSRRRSASPRWLRDILDRGLAPDREKRFASMDKLLAAVGRARARPRRRVSALTGGLIVVLGTFAGWRLSHARRFDCAPPGDRIAAAWPARDSSSSKRASIRAALKAGATADGEATWQRLSSTLDQYVGQWSVMYREACEATHFRGEQSEQVLDMRMRCLNENLDGVRALTDGISSSNLPSPAMALNATSELTPLRRCADVRLLRSAVPLPRDDLTLRAVHALEASLRSAEALMDLGRLTDSLATTVALRPQVEATNYKPLLGQLLELQGRLEIDLADARKSETTLREALSAAVAGGDDVTAAKAASSLIYLTGLVQGRFQESVWWARFADALLDRAGPGNLRIRGWVREDEGDVLLRARSFDKALVLFEQATALKSEALGPDHPDVAASLMSQGITLAGRGDPQRAIETVDRAIAILAGHGQFLAYALNDRGEILLRLGRTAEARIAFERSLRTEQGERPLTNALTGLGRVEVTTGNPKAAVPLLERALRIREGHETDRTLVAEAQFALACALWDSRGDRTRALSLAKAARSSYAGGQATRELAEVDAWLATTAVKRAHR